MKLEDFQKEMNHLNEWAQHGCCDGSCQIEKPKGMHTNGGCRCSPRAFSDCLLDLASRLESMGKYKRFEK